MMSEIISPLHPDIIPKLDPEYVAFYNQHLATKLGPHQVPWDPSIRNTPAVLGGSQPLTVGSTQDFSLSNCKVRVFTPEGNAPHSGWPVFLFFHGGGWTLGNINAENAFATNMCKRASCIVVSVDYRLGPGNPYPAAVEDAIDALHWVHSSGGGKLRVDLSRFALGGSSSGANLAAVVTHVAALSNPPISLMFQLLVVPVVDNTASPSGHPYASWREYAHTAGLTPAKMLWFRNNYTPNESDRTKWSSSPIFAPDKSFENVPNAWIGVAEVDILKDEGIAYANKLRRAGRQVQLNVYQNAPHPIMAMDGKVLQVGRQLVSDAAEALARAFESIPPVHK